MREKGQFTGYYPTTWIICICLLTGLLTGSAIRAQQNPFGRAEFQPDNLISDTAVIKNRLKDANVFMEAYPDSAIPIVVHALRSSYAIKYNRGILNGLFQLGLLYHLKNEHLRSIRLLEAALLYCDTSRYGHNMAVKIYTGIGYRYQFLEKNDSAAAYFYRALDDIDRWKIDNPDVLINTYYKMVLLWLTMNEDIANVSGMSKYTENALNYLNKAQLLETKNKKNLAKIILSKGHINLLQHHTDSAIHYYQRYLGVVKGENIELQSGMMISVYNNISESFLEQNRPDSALFYSSRAIREMKEANKNWPLIWIPASYNSGKALLMQQKYKEAISVTEPALKAARDISLQFRYMGHDILSKAYAAYGNYPLAWQHQEAYTIIKDSIRGQDNLRSINQMEMKYQVAERKQELAEKGMALAVSDSRLKTKNMWIGGIFASLMMVTFVSVMLYRQNVHKQRLALLRLEKEKEVSLLHAMIEGEEKERSRLAGELHDGIGGLLGTIRMQLGATFDAHRPATGENEYRDILTLLDDTYGELRKTAHNLMPELLQQEGLAIAVGSFCDRIRRADGLDVVFNTTGDIPRLKPGLELALYRIIQELLHNILKHAKASQAFVQILFIDNRLGITVEDDGIGMTDKPEGNKKGMGLKAIRDRVKRMGGKFDIISDPGAGSSIDLEFTITSAETL